MILPRAIYGNDRGAHSFLRGSSPEYKELFTSTAWRTDLPANAPNMAWQPFLRGFIEAGHYVLAYISPDLLAHRAGMVLSQAIFVPLEAITDGFDFGPLFDVVRRLPDQDEPLQPLIASARVEKAAEPPSASAVAVVEAMLKARKLPVVHLGQDGFDEIAQHILARLPARLKREFAFRLSFGPYDLEGDPQKFISTPASLESRWHEFPIVQAGASVDASPATSMLLGMPEGIQLSQFAKEIGADLADLRSVGLLASTFDIWQSSDSTLEKFAAVIRLVARLSPDAASGTEIKSRIAADASNAVPSARPSQIRGLKNLEELGSFPGAATFWKAVEDNVCSTAKTAPDASFFDNARDALRGEGADRWVHAIASGFRAAGNNLTDSLANALWLDWGDQPSDVLPMLGALSSRPTTEAALLRTFPEQPDRTVASEIAQTSRERQWLTLHGTCVATLYSPEEALRKQIEIDHDPSFMPGIRAVLAKGSDELLVQVAFVEDDARLITLAAEACERSPQLLAQLDFGRRRGLEILQAKVQRSPGTLTEFSRWSAVLEALLSIDPRDRGFDQLWQALGKTVAADLSQNPDRRSIWHRIPGAARKSFVDATADGWLLARERGIDDQKVLETELENAVVDPTRIDTHLAGCIPERLELGAALFKKLGRLSETAFTGWLKQIDRRMKFGGVPEQAARALGEVASQRFWTSAAYRIFEMANERADMAPALRRCISQLSYYDQAKIHWSGAPNLPAPSDDDLWQLFEKIVIEVYPQGPQENEIWSRAGGAMDVLEYAGNARARWHSAIRRLRAGGGSTSANRLLSEMRAEFPANRDLESIAAFAIFNDEESRG